MTLQVCEVEYFGRLVSLRLKRGELRTNAGGTHHFYTRACYAEVDIDGVEEEHEEDDEEDEEDEEREEENINASVCQ